MTREFWYICQQQDGTCKIERDDSVRDLDDCQEKTPLQQWGAYTSEPEAIAKRIGLIRAGKCKPQ